MWFFQKRKQADRPLNRAERIWLNLMLTPQFSGRDILKEQLRHVLVHVEQGDAFHRVMFAVPKSVEKYPHAVRVPIEMRVHLPDRAPVVFLLHVADGTISELELFPADSSAFDPKSLCFDHLEYVIDPSITK